MITTENFERLNDTFAEGVTFEDLSDRYEMSEFGVYHATQPLRFSQRYAYDRELSLTDLGDDVDPVRHMRYTDEQITLPMVAMQNKVGDERLDDFAVISLRGAARIHDIGECAHPKLESILGSVVGDIVWDERTDDHGADERAIRQYIYGQLYYDIPNTSLAAADYIVDGTTGSLERELFQAGERLGYYKTALKAGNVALNLIQNGQRQLDIRLVQLSRTAFNVSADHIDFLQSNAERFPYIRSVLTDNAGLQNRINSTLGQLSYKPYRHPKAV